MRGDEVDRGGIEGPALEEDRQAEDDLGHVLERRGRDVLAAEDLGQRRIGQVDPGERGERGGLRHVHPELGREVGRDHLRRMAGDEERSRGRLVGRDPGRDRQRVRRVEVVREPVRAGRLEHDGGRVRGEDRARAGLAHAWEVREDRVAERRRLVSRRAVDHSPGHVGRRPVALRTFHGLPDHVREVVEVELRAGEPVREVDERLEVVDRSDVPAGDPRGEAGEPEEPRDGHLERLGEPRVPVEERQVRERECEPAVGLGSGVDVDPERGGQSDHELVELVGRHAQPAEETLQRVVGSGRRRVVAQRRMNELRARLRVRPVEGDEVVEVEGAVEE